MQWTYENIDLSICVILIITLIVQTSGSLVNWEYTARWSVDLAVNIIILS